MSLTVRYPNGATVTYNKAHKIAYRPDGHFEVLDTKGHWVASIQGSSGAIVEAGLPCAITGPGESDRSRLRYVLENLRHMDEVLLRQLKAALKDFDARTYSWG